MSRYTGDYGSEDENAQLIQTHLAAIAGLKGKAFWASVKEINELFKTLRLKPEDREQLWRNLSASCDAAKAAADDWQKRAEANAVALEREIVALRHGHWSHMRRQYKEFWEHRRSIQNLFDTLKPLRREDRERLWADVAALCDQVRRQEEAEWGDRRQHSAELRQRIMRILDSAENAAKGARNEAECLVARDRLDEAMELMRALGKSQDEKMLQEDHNQCWERYRQAQDALKWRRHDMAEGAYSQLHGQAADLEREARSGDPYSAMDGIKAAQRELASVRLEKYQRDDIRRILNSAWESAVARIEHRRADAQRKHDNWVRGSEDKISRLEALLEKNEGVIESLREQIDRLENAIDGAWSDDYPDRARGWIEEKEQKIRDITATNRDLEDKIRSIRGELRD